MIGKDKIHAASRTFKICVGSVITCFIPYKDLRWSNWASSAIVVSLDHELLDLRLKSPIINAKCGLLLDISANIFSKWLINESNSSEIWLDDRCNEKT